MALQPLLLLLHRRVYGQARARRGLGMEKRVDKRSSEWLDFALCVCLCCYLRSSPPHPSLGGRQAVQGRDGDTQTEQSLGVRWLILPPYSLLSQAVPGFTWLVGRRATMALFCLEGDEMLEVRKLPPGALHAPETKWCSGSGPPAKGAPASIL